MSASVSSPVDSDVYIPPLVAKVARPGRRGHLVREAWFYDELATLQGVSVPRCYGWFEAEVDVEDGTTVMPWVEHTEDSAGYSSSSGFEFELELWGPALAALGSTTNVISILLLERVGPERIPISTTFDE